MFYSQPGTGYHKFNWITQAKEAIETIGLQYTAPAEPVKEDHRALLIGTKREMTMREFAKKYGFKYSEYFFDSYFHKSRRQVGHYGKRGFIIHGENGQMACCVTDSEGGGFEFDPTNPIESAAAVDAIGLDHWQIWRRYGRKVDWRDREAVSASWHEWSLAVDSYQRSKFRHVGTSQTSEAV